LRAMVRTRMIATRPSIVLYFSELRYTCNLAFLLVPPPDRRERLHAEDPKKRRRE